MAHRRSVDYDSDGSLPASQSYRQLKNKISAIKEAQGVQHSKAQIRCENLTLLQAQLEHEQIEQAQREKIESLKSHLAAVIERTTRIRNAYEKEKKHLTGQVDKFSRERVHAAREYEQELQHLRELHEAQVANLEGDKANLRAQLEEAFQKLKQSKVDIASQQVQLYDQYQNDLKQVQRANALELARGHDNLAATQRELEESRDATVRCKEDLNATRSACLTHQQTIADLQRQLQAARSDARSLQLDRDEAAVEAERVSAAHQDELTELASQSEAALQEYKQQKAEEIQQIHDKLQAVLSKKNVTISQLRASLEAAHVRLEVHEKDVRREKRQLLEQLGNW